MGAVAIQPIGRSKKELARFFDVADHVYAGDPNWVPPLRDDVALVFAEKNPFWQHAEIQLFVAVTDGRDAGRIAAIVDRAHNEFHNEKVVFFGFFESENDPAVAKALFETVAAWGKERGMTVLRGPANPSLNDECGLLVDGFDSPPVLMMTYNPRSYVSLVEGAGFTKAKDLLAYWFPLEEKPLERLSRLADRFRKNVKDVIVRTVGKGDLARDLPRIREVYNEAWEKNWGFVPMTPSEMDFMAKRLKPLVVEELLWLAEAKKPDGSLEPIAFMLMLPDYNVAIAKAGGSLMPFGWLKFLLALPKVKTVRVITLGIKTPHRLSGLQSIMMADSLRYLLKKGYTGAEVSWLLDDNELIVGSMRLWGGRLYKTYRIYDRPV